MTIWALAVGAVRVTQPGRTETALRAVITTAQNEAEATGLAYHWARNFYPLPDGWANHLVSVVEATDEVLIDAGLKVATD